MTWVKKLFKPGKESQEEKPGAAEPQAAPQGAQPALQPERAVHPPAAENAPPRPAPQIQSDEAVARRARRAAESLLENEALTADLDDSAAKVLLKWGTDLAKETAASTAGLDDEQAEEAMGDRLRATRRLLRSVDKWIAGQSSLPAEEKSALLANIHEQLGIIQGAGPALPDLAHLETFIDQAVQPSASPAQLIERLRQFYQPPPGSI